MAVRRVALTGEQMRLSTGPSIYAWRRGDEWLYIGSSASGWRRLLAHKIIGRLEPIRDTDILEITPYPDADIIGLTAREHELIRRHQPKYNIAQAQGNGGGLPEAEGPCIVCGGLFRRTRPWQKYCALCKAGGTPRFAGPTP